MQRRICGSEREQVTGIRRELRDWCCLRDVTRCHITGEVMAGSFSRVEEKTVGTGCLN